MKASEASSSHEPYNASCLSVDKGSRQRGAVGEAVAPFHTVLHVRVDFLLRLEGVLS